jgi:plasmid maintenance system antidote protein VapI
MQAKKSLDRTNNPRHQFGMQNILNEWLNKHGRGSASKLAEASGLSRSYISELKSGKCGARLTADTALALERGTGIKAAVWLGLEQPKRKAKA